MVFSPALRPQLPPARHTHFTKTSSTLRKYGNEFSSVLICTMHTKEDWYLYDFEKDKDKIGRK